MAHQRAFRAAVKVGDLIHDFFWVENHLMEKRGIGFCLRDQTLEYFGIHF
ncbi:hypothetical protein BN2497_9635 [Janthinobacterium sp. CG23_2]|nr:hypothetical protein BN2497_9635 [Janthinobacterium sp. CG23_2]CUU31215.1 hypothetical protein BN3177_9635 [Janthinobacterium sp. CG23_2]